jgi:metal-dependent amidase/aminoacylase/carboxypeptidase family protein
MDPREIARKRAERAHESLVGLSHWIHANPELAFEEQQASGWVAEFLEKAGFDVARVVGGLETALAGHFGPGPLHVALMAEYDALPEVGHACGHNVIAATAVGAAVALAGLRSIPIAFAALKRLKPFSRSLVAASTFCMVWLCMIAPIAR